MGKIIVVRHGVTAMNQSQTFQPHNTPLAEEGINQAKSLGERLRDMKIVKVLTSDLLRTKQTTENILSAFDKSVPVVETTILREREFGDLKGTPFSQVEADLFHPKSTYQPKNGESWNTFHERAGKAWDYVLGHARESLKEPDDVLLVVTHGLVKSSFASRNWGFKERVIFDNTSVSIVSASVPHEVTAINCTDHLQKAKL